MTGEGYLDRQSFSGKVVGGVISSRGRKGPDPVHRRRRRRKAPHAPAEPGTAGFELVSLVERFGPERARSEVLELFEDVVAQHISSM